MYEFIVHALQELKPPYALLIQACIVLFFPYLLWRTMKLGRWFPLGVIQIFSGVLLGPAIFGAIDASLLSTVVPDPSKPIHACTNPEAKQLFNALFGQTCYHGTVVNRAAGIGSVAIIAVCLFGFLAGADADKELIAKSGKSVMSIGIIGMLFGWALASVAGYMIYYAIPEARGAKAAPFAFSIAYGLVIAVSALPVLALILRGLDITRRRMGAVALASASIADTMMWLGLGVVVALTLGGSLPAALTKAALGGLLSFGFIKWIASPILNRMIETETAESAIITFTGLSIFVASAITGITELHPVLGAFVAGFFLPDKVREMAAHRLDLCATLILMPFFFLNTGLNTKFSFSDPNVWILFGISSFLCVFGKMVGHGVAARMTGESWPFAMSIGMLLQTKGLMGIIVIVVFFEKEVVSPLLFAAAVFMCMFSTGLPTPAMRWMFNKYGEELKDGGKKEEQILVEPGPVVSQAPASAAAAATSPPMARLDFEGGFSFPVMRGAVTIGRHSEDDIQIKDIRVSRHHARLTVAHDGRFEIQNLTADRTQARPITINGVEHIKAILSEGDQVVLGGGPLFTVRYTAAKAKA